MRPLQLDFHPLSARRARRRAWATLSIVVLCVASAGVRLAQLNEEVDTLEARHEVLAARLHPARARSVTVGPELTRRIVSANQAIDELAVPWDSMFRAIESADARGLGVMSLVPNARQRSVRLSGEARSVPELLAYVDRLGALQALDQVRLEGYETVVRDGADVVSFTVAATWRLH
jgi:Tfp pilus assembly protein PilN